MSQAPVLPRGFELPLEPRLPRIGSVDAVALEERAASLARRSIKRESKLQALELAVRMIDLTTLEGADTPGKVAALCSKAVRPDPVDTTVPSVAAVCVYPNLVPTAVARLRDTSVKVASVATAFPSGQSPLEGKLAEVREVVEAGADEVDMVIDRGAFLSGRYAKVYDEIVRVKEACGEAHLKVIHERVGCPVEQASVTTKESVDNGRSVRARVVALLPPHGLQPLSLLLGAPEVDRP